MAFFNAVCHAHAECMELLTDAGADVHTPLNEPLLIAARNGYAKCLELLIRKGADVNRPMVCKEANAVAIFSIWGSTALREASECNHTVCVELLLKSGAHVNSNTIVSVINDDVSTCSDHTLRLLLAAGANPDSHSKIPLKFTVKQNIKCAKELLEAEAQFNTLNKNKRNALSNHIEKRISQNKFPDRTMVLLLYGAGETLDGITIR